MLEQPPSLSSARLPGRLLSILIGIDAYGRGIPPLRNAVRDVQAVAQVLREAHGYETRLLLDEAATRQGILSQLASLATEVSPDTRLVIYFAGHGLAEETAAEDGGPQGFLLPQDASRDDPATLLPMVEIEGLLSRLPCQHLLLLLDCCFAGAFRWSKTRSITPRRSKLYRERFERYLRDPAWQVIASAAADERALDTLLGAGLGGRGAEGENSPFAAALCRALHGAADLRIDGQPGDGVIIGSELHYYLETAFERLEQQVGRTMQKPLLWSKKERDKGQFVFLTPGRALSLPTALELNEHNDPYRGLASYGEEHRMLFFGRSAVADALTAQVEGHELLVLVGASGTGKSSLVRAGLLPRLRAKSAPAWHIEPPARPGTTPLVMLQSLASSLYPGSSMLSTAVAGFCQAQPGTPIFLCIDQVEEVVSQAASELAAFLAELQAARQAGGGQLHIVLTLRSDFEPYFAPLWRDQAAGAERFLIPPMTRAELREAIEGPASERVLFFEPPSLVDRLLDEVADMPGPLPLLSFVLSEMYRASLRRPLDRTLSDADYQALGGVGGALSQRADAVYSSYTDEADRRAFRYLLLRMVVPGELARRRVLDSELSFSEPGIEARVRGMVRRLLSERLLVADRDRTGRDFVEPAHDKLVMGWPQLGRFLAEDTGYLLQHSLSQAAQGWQAASRARAYLWDRDPLLPQALTTLMREPGRYNRQEEDFIRKSQARRRLGQGGIAALVLVFVAGLLGWLIQERSSTQKIRGQLLASYEERGRQLLLQGDVPRALLWLNRVYQAGGSSDSLRLLLAQAASHSQIAPPARRRASGKILQVVLSPDGMRLLALPAAGFPPHIRDIGTGEILFVLPEQQSQVRQAIYSPHGDRILTVGTDEVVHLWDAEQGILLDTFSHTSRVNSVAFSPDGQRIVSAVEKGAVLIWSALGGELLATRSAAPEVRHLSYSQDGAFLVAQGQRTLFIWNEASGKPCPLPPGMSLLSDDFSLFGEGRGVQLRTADRERRVWNFQLEDLRAVEPRTLSTEQPTCSTLRLSPRGHRLLCIDDAGQATLFDLPAGQPLATVPRATATSQLQPEFSADGTRLVLPQGSDAAQILDDNGHILGKVAVPNLRQVTLSRDGKHLATVDEHGDVRIWSTQTFVATSTLHRLSPSESPAKLAQMRGVAAFSDLPMQSLERLSGRLSVGFSPGRAELLLFTADTNYPWGHADVVSLDSLAKESSRTLKRRDSWIGHAVLSPDGRLLVAPSWDSRVRLIDTGSGAVARSLSGHSERVTSTAMTSDARRILTGSEDHTVKVWDGGSGALITTHLGHTDKVVALTLSSDGKYALSTQGNGAARLWDVATGRLRQAFEDDRGQWRSSHLSADATRVVIATSDLTRIWITDRAAPQQVLPRLEVGDLRAVSEDGARLFFEHGDDLVVRDVDGSGRRTLPRVHQRWLRGASFSSDGSLAVTASADGTACIFDIARGTLLQTLSGHADEVASAHFSHSGKLILTASGDKTARIWEVSTGALLRTLSGHQSGLRDAVFSQDDQRILSVGDSDHALRLWEANSGQPLTTVQGAPFDNVLARYRPDGKRILTSDSDHSLKIWDGQGMELLRMLPTSPQQINTAFWSADGTRILSGTEDGISIWHPDTGERLLAIDQHAGGSQSPFETAKLSPDKAHIASLRRDHSLQLWDGRVGALRHTLDSGQAESTDFAFSPDSRYLLVSSLYAGVRLFDVQSGRMVGELRGHTGQVTAIAFSPDGTKVVTGSADRLARVFAVPGLQLLHTLVGHGGEILSITLNPQSTLALTGSRDGTARLWDLKTGLNLYAWSALDPRQPLAIFGPEGQSIATASRRANPNPPDFPGYPQRVQDEQAHLYRVDLYRLQPENRSPAEIDDLVRCRVPLRFDGETIVPARRDVQACRRLLPRK